MVYFHSSLNWLPQAKDKAGGVLFPLPPATMFGLSATAIASQQQWKESTQTLKFRFHEWPLHLCQYLHWQAKQGMQTALF